jgi:nitrite reductase/ring-hydroxylating ferredoxin subunit
MTPSSAERGDLMPVNTGGVTDVVDRLENAGNLDPVIAAVRTVVNAALKPQRLRDALHGVWLGHPLHPSLTDIPIGSWSAAAVLDAMPGTGNGASTLIAVGCAGYVPTILAGWADWSDLHEQQQRVGLVHAAAGALAFSCYAASLAARAQGSTTRGKAWSYAGLAVMSATAYLGGHLAFRQAAGVNHVEAVPHLFPEGWHDIGQLDDLPDGELTQRAVDGVELCVVRRGKHVDVLANSCAHLAAPLSEGSFTAEEGQGCVVCPWHGSVFRLSDGGVVHGPATAPMPRFETRVVDGAVEVMLPGAG